MKEVEQLERTGFVRIKMPVCRGDLPKFERKLAHIRKEFGDKIEERETNICNRIWFEFTLRRD